MAGASLLALLDDIALILDDVALMSKVAAKKTAGVLGDDLALNAEQVSGVSAERELPVVWAVAKGSFKNKFILVPLALVLSALVPWTITPLLMLGGAFLCFEGFEKLAHKFLYTAEEDEAHHKEMIEALTADDVDMVAFEKDKIKGAIRTDFILSAEIIVIALGTVQDATFMLQAIVVSLLALFITVGVYSLVAGIVKLDDAGLALMKSEADNLWGKFKRAFGSGLLSFAPRLMKTLTIVGTAAMFLVGGGILLHGVPFIEPYVHHAVEWAEGVNSVGGVLSVVVSTLINAVIGIIAGGIIFVVISSVQKIMGKRAES